MEFFNQDSPNRILILQDPSYNDRYVYYEYDGGYIIADRYSGCLSEMRFEHIFDGEDEFIYNGPLEYYKLEGTTAVNLMTNQNVDIEQVVECPLVPVSSETSFTMDPQSLTFTPGQNLLATPWPNYTYPQATDCCGSTAAAMWIKYLDYHENSAYVPSNLESSDGHLLIEGMIPFIEQYYLGGSTPQMVKDGINFYFWLGGFNVSVHNADFLDPLLRARIDTAHRPVIIGLYANSPYGAHWMTAFGYHYTAALAMDWVIANDGLGSLYYCNPAYVHYMVY